jgi:hypothetical protein
MWVAVFLLFVGSEYRIQPLPFIFTTQEACELQRINNEQMLNISKPEGGFHISRCVDIGTQT